MLIYLSLFAVLVGAAILAWRDTATFRRKKKLRRAKQEELRWRPKFRKGLLADRWSLRKTRRLTDQRMRASEEA